MRWDGNYNQSMLVQVYCLTNVNWTDLFSNAVDKVKLKTHLVRVTFSHMNDRNSHFHLGKTVNMQDKDAARLLARWNGTQPE